MAIQALSQIAMTPALGTAATKNAVTSTSDGTADRLLTVGYGGFGGLATPSLANVDTTTTPMMTYTVGSPSGTLPAGVNPNGTVDFIRSSATNFWQRYTPIGQTAQGVLSRQYVRTWHAINSEWNPWAETLNSLTYTDYTVTKAGAGATGTWGISVTGNAGTATVLATARNINGVAFNGSANITIADSTKQVSNANLTALSGLTGTANKGIEFTGAGTMALYDRFATYTNLTLASPFIWDSAGDAASYHPPSYAKVGDTVRLRGKVTLSGTHTTSATVNVQTVATLPAGFRPARRKAFQIFWDTDSPLRFAYCLVFVNADGTIVLLTPDGGQTYPFTEGHFPLDQIWYDLAD